MATARRPRPSAPKDGPARGADSRRRAPQVGVLAEADHHALAEALLAVAPEGLADGTLAPLADALGELAALDAAGEAALDGGLVGAELLALAEASAPWPETLRSRRFAEMPDTPPVLRLTSGGAGFTALYAAEFARGGAEAAGVATRRLLGTYLARAEPLARIVLGARALREGGVTPEAFAALLKDNLALLAAPPDPHKLVEGLRQARTLVPRPFGPTPGDKLAPWLDWVRKSPFSAFLLPENQAAWHCVTGLAGFYQGVALPTNSPGPASISPGVLCHSPALAAGTTLLLRGRFGPQALPGGVWGVSVSGRPASITRWTANEIEITTDALRRGCNPVQWSFLTDQDISGNGADAACSDWLRRPLLSQLQVNDIEILRRTGRWVDPGSVSVLGPEIAVFDTPPPPRDGFIPCAEVTLRWRLSALPCAQDRAAVSVRLLRDGVELARDLPFAGSRVIADPRSAEYVLEASAAVPGGPACNPPAIARLPVPRAPAALTLTLPPEVLDGMPAEASVAIPCDAPPGGQLVELVADAAALAAPAQVLIPAGQRSVRFNLSAGLRCGEAKIEARSPGHRPASGAVCVIRALGIAPNQALRVTGCARDAVTLRLTCLGRLSRLAAALVAPDGERTPLTPIPAAMPPAGCLAETLVSLGVPALEPGAYRIELGNGVGSAASIALTVDPPRPEIVGAPAEVNETIQMGACPPAEQAVRMSARGHGRIRAVYENPDGNREQIVVRGGTAVCPGESVELSFVFDRNGTLVVTPERDGVAGPARRIPVRLNFGAGVYRSASFFAADPAGQSIGRAVAMTREEQGPAMPLPTNEGSIAQGQTRSFALARCVATTFIGTRPDVPDPVSDSGGTIRGGSVPRGPFIGHPDAPPMAPALNI